MEVALYIIIIVAVVAVSIYFLVKELRKPKEEAKNESAGVLVNKRQIEKSVQNIESMIVLADGNDRLCNKLVELKDEIRFLNPSKNPKVKQIDEKIANKLDDIKIEISKDKEAETIFRMIEEVEGFIAQRIKELDA